MNLGIYKFHPESLFRCLWDLGIHEPTKLVGIITPLLPALEGLVGEAEEPIWQPEGARQGPGYHWSLCAPAELQAVGLVSARVSLGAIYIGNRLIKS